MQSGAWAGFPGNGGSQVFLQGQKHRLSSAHRIVLYACLLIGLSGDRWLRWSFSARERDNNQAARWYGLYPVEHVSKSLEDTCFYSKGLEW